MWKANRELTETAHCPVCKVIFGRRDKSKPYAAHCEECKATFKWIPNAKKPTASLDKDLKKGRCGCALGH